jgi:virginiamycin B lyase
VTRRIQLSASAPYNIWVGGGSVWVAEDQGGRVVRVSPAKNRVVARIRVGDGPSDMVFAGSSAWVIDHRDRTLFRIQLATNTASRLATIGKADDMAPERLAILDGSIWVTGRGTPLLQADAETGATRRSIDLDGTGIDIVAAAGALWVPVRTAAVDRTGFPTMTALRRISPSGEVRTVATVTGRVDVHGLAPAGGAVWVADNTDGFLYRIPT